jgi:hypothetical protein
MKNFTVLHFIYIVSHQTEKEENTVKVFFLPAKKIEIPVLLQRAHENSYDLGMIQYNIILYGQTRLFALLYRIVDFIILYGKQSSKY